MRRLGKRVLVATLSGSIVALGALAGCGGGGGNEGSSEESQFTKNVSGELSVWGFNNADDVGKARLDLREAAAQRSQDHARPDRIRLAEVHHAAGQQDPARRSPDGPTVRGDVRGAGPDPAAGPVLQPVRRRRRSRTGTRR